MKKIYKYLLLGVTFWLGSCSKLLDVQPRQSLDTATALTTVEGIRAGAINVYTNLKALELYGRDLLAISECLADETRIINRAGGRFVNEGNNAINNHMGGWSIYYVAINQANLVLKNIPSSALPQTEKDTMEGEMKFLRALLYFNLSRVYCFDPKAAIASLDKGGVPLLLDGVDSITQVVYAKRNTVAEVYAQIYKDLKDAIAKAPVGGGPNRATKAAAQALLARVALYNEDWDLAISSATDALGAGVGKFVGTADLFAAWRANSNPESIFEVLYQTTQESLGVNNSLQSAYTSIESVSQATIFAAARPTPLPPASGWGAVVPTAAFLNLHVTGDVRRQLYQDGLNRSNSVVTECTKFLGKTGTVYMDNVPVIRFSELYLIRAEANIRGNKDLVQALSDLNRIRTRAGLAEAKGLTQTQLLNEMILQRRLELAFEGHRWFDLKRWKQDITKSTGNLQYGDTRILAPLPNSEILANPALVQNAGY
jgi:starch-binding outer membrane protein, SusD/RagB family